MVSVVLWQYQIHRQTAKALPRPGNESGLGRTPQSAADRVPACRANRQAGADTQCRRWSFVGWPCEYAPARGVRAIALPSQPPVARWSPAVREGFKSGRWNMVSSKAKNGFNCVSCGTHPNGEPCLTSVFARGGRTSRRCRSREFVDAGGLMSYGVHYPDLYRRAATHVHKIFNGAKPADLPVEQPTRFEFVINLRTAKALGLNVPDKLLAIAAQRIH